VLRRAVELGVNFIDTADSYGPHVSETLIAEALYPYPDDLVIATKGGLERPGPGRWRANGRPVRLVLVGHVAGQVVAGRDLPAKPEVISW
jgi:pyridoxine 4-dehydrogenase